MAFVLSPPGQHGLPFLTPGYLMLFVNIRPDSERQRQNGANQKIHRTWVGISRCFLPSFFLPFFSFFAEVHTAKSSHFHNKINSAPDMRNLFRTCNSLLCPPSPPPTTSITANDFDTFSQTKLEKSVVSSHLHTHRTSNQPHPLLKLPSSPSVPSLRRKHPNFSSPAILQHVL